MSLRSEGSSRSPSAGSSAPSGTLRSRTGTTPRFELAGLAYDTPIVKTIPTDLDEVGRYQGLLGLRPFAAYRVMFDFPGRRLRLQPLEDENTTTYPWAQRYGWFSGQLVVPVDLDGALVPFLLDTGAEVTFISQGWAERAGKRRDDKRVDVQHVDGRRLVATVEPTSLTFAGVAATSRRFPEIDLSAISRLAGIELHGLLGLDMLARGRLTLDPATSSFRFELPEEWTPQPSTSASSASSRSANCANAAV